MLSSEKVIYKKLSGLSISWLCIEVIFLMHSISLVRIGSPKAEMSFGSTAECLLIFVSAHCVLYIMII